MFSFAHPALLYLLFLVPAYIGLFILARYARKKKLSKFGNLSVIHPLMPEVSRYNAWIRLVVQSLALASLIFACARPRAGEKEENRSKEGIEVMIAFDVSRSMLASSTDDGKGISRLERAKYILTRLIDKLDNDRVGLIVYAWTAYTQLPITNDFVSAKRYVNDLSTDLINSQGTAIATAIEMALQSFSPAEDVGKAIILITDAEDHEPGAIEAAKLASDQGIQVDVIGVGSTKGSPIPLSGSNNQFLKDMDGNVVTTALNEELAKEIAKAGDGVYITGAASSALDDLATQLDTLKKMEFKTVKYKASAEQFPVFAWIAFGLLILDIFILDRKNGLLKNINFFDRRQ